VHDWLVVGPFRASSSSAEVSASGTAQIHATAELPRFFADSRLDLGLPIAVTFAVAVWLLLGRTASGYELRAVGANADAARTAGIPVARRLYLAMALSGALSGIGGALLILGTEHRYPGVFRTGYGFDGIAVALVGGGHPLGILAAAGFFGALRAGATRLQLVGIHPSFAELIQGLAVLFVATRALFAAVPTRFADFFRRRA
jgi:general nucleoside transport system permease protein